MRMARSSPKRRHPARKNTVKKIVLTMSCRKRPSMKPVKSSR